MGKYINPFTDIGFKMLFGQGFKKKETECESDFERWIYVLKHMEALNKLPWAAKRPHIQDTNSI